MEKDRLSPEEYHEKITAAGIRDGVVAFSDVNNMSVASCDDTFTVRIDLYRLLDRYLRNLDARKRINALIDAIDKE
jgi:hypothetical protein